MSDQVNVGEFTLEISGDQIVVRDATGGIVETVSVDDLNNGQLMLPTGQVVDVASLLAGDQISELQTAAGGVEGNGTTVAANGGTGNFQAFQGDNAAFGNRGSVGALNGTNLAYGTPSNGGGYQAYEVQNQSQSDRGTPEPEPIVVTWASHDPWQIQENVTGGVFSKVVEGNPSDFTFDVSDSRFEVVNGVLRVRNGYSFDFENEPAIDLQITATSRTGDVKTLTAHVGVTDANETPTDISLTGGNVVENVSGAVVGDLSVVDPDAGDTHTFAVSDSRFEVVNGQLKLKDGVSLDFETEPTLNVVVTATDGGGKSVQETFTLSVGNANEAQTSLTLSNDTINENDKGAVVGSLTVADPDAGDKQSFDVSDNRFHVVNGELRLKGGVSFDHEAEPTVNVTVTATDKGGHQISQTFTINVADVNEAQTGMILTGNAVTENAAGAVVGTLSVTDPDAGDSQSFQVSDSRFEVVNGQLKLKDGVSLDHEAGSSVDVTVTATDGGNHQYAKTFTINVGDANEGPTNLTLTGNTVTENDKGATIGTLSVVDADAGDKQHYDVSDSRFHVVNGELRLKGGVSIDYETEPTVDVTVTATDKGGNQVTETFKVNVTDVNEQQTAISLTGSTVAENAAGAVIGTLSVTDPDAGDKQSFQVSDSRFEVVNGQLKLKDGVSLDHEAADSIDVTVTATDMGGHQIANTFTIAVGDVNEGPSNLTLTGNTVAENDKGATIGTLSVVDADAGDKQHYDVSDSRFHVVNGELRLKGGVSIDYETEPTVNVTVTATDKGGSQVTETFKINVTDVNEAQTAFTTAGAMRVSENAGGAVAGAVMIADPDAGDKQTFTVSDNRFEVVNNSLKLKDGVSLNYEAGASVNVTVTATDMGGHQISKTITVGVDDVNEAQTSISLMGSSVAENAGNNTAGKATVIGSVLVTDPDAGDTQTFNVSDSRFQVVNGQLVLKAGASVDYETEPSISLKITATDKGGNQISTTANIQVSNVNEGQTGMTLSASKVAENASGATIGTLTTTDPDANDTQTYTVSDSRFEVVNNALKLKSGQSLNYETEPSVNVTVTAKDSGGNTYAKTFTVGVTDVNEAQTGMSLSNSKVAENASGATVGTLTTTDPDANDTQTYTVSDSRFEVVNNALKLKSGVSINYETEPSVNVTVTAKDTGGNSYSKAFTIGVTDVNEAQTGMSLSASKVAENASGATIGTLTTTDPDANDTQTYTVSDSRFEVVNNALKLKSGVSINYETEPSVNVTVTAKDTGGNSYSKAFTIGVTDVNEAQTGMSISATKVAENSAGATIGTLTTTDPDANDSQTYTVSDNRFEVVNSQLKLKSGVSLDYEAGSTVNVTVTATDKGQNQYSKAFVVQVTDVNEIAPVVVAKDGHVTNHFVDTVTTYAPVASTTVGNYLYSNDSANVKAPAASDMGAIDGSNMTLKMETEVQVTFQKEAAGNHNMIGTYQYDASGKVIAGSVKFVWLDASASNEGQLGATMVKDFLGYSQANTVSLGTMASGTHVGFFTISNGASDSGNKSLISDAASGTSSQANAMAAINSQLSIKIDANGNGNVYVGNTKMSGDVFFTHDKTLNTDFNGSNDIVHMTSGTHANLPGQLVIGVEDLNGGGDKDYNDVVFSVNLGSYDTNKVVASNVVQPQVDFSDADSSTLTQATIQTSGFQSGDVLTIPTSSLFNVSVTHTTAEYTITITGKTGGETVDQYENFVNSISFSTSSKVEGDRHIDYSVTDNGGLKSTVDRADISVDSEYHVSTSELSNGKTTFGDGADTLYINTDKFGPVDMGDGYDTVHLAQQGRGFDHNDAVKLSGIEEIDTTGYGVNNVTLNINDVLNMTDDDHHLTVIGDKGDVVTLESSGKGSWEVTGQDAQFTTYHYTDSSHEAIVQISNQLTAQVS